MFLAVVMTQFGPEVAGGKATPTADAARTLAQTINAYIHRYRMQCDYYTARSSPLLRCGDILLCLK